jgi:hypothetical protein
MVLGTSDETPHNNEDLGLHLAHEILVGEKEESQELLDEVGRDACVNCALHEALVTKA